MVIIIIIITRISITRIIRYLMVVVIIKGYLIVLDIFMGPEIIAIVNIHITFINTTFTIMAVKTNFKITTTIIPLFDAFIVIRLNSIQFL